MPESQAVYQRTQLLPKWPGLIPETRLFARVSVSPLNSQSLRLRARLRASEPGPSRYRRDPSPRPHKKAKLGRELGSPPNQISRGEKKARLPSSKQGFRPENQAPRQSALGTPPDHWAPRQTTCRKSDNCIPMHTTAPLSLNTRGKKMSIGLFLEQFLSWHFTHWTFWSGIP
jgi:hypothetical protein